MLPRCIVSGKYYLVTRRCTQRQFLLRPSVVVNEVIGYCLAEATARHDIEVIAVMAMSNHYHAVVWDPEGKVTDFYEHFHKMTAKVLNARFGRWENLWAGGGRVTSLVELVEPQDVVAKVVYALANPVASQLVAEVRHWPGFDSYRATMLGKTLTFRRPRWFFSKDGIMPETAELRFAKPRCFSDLTHEQWRERIARGLDEQEAKAARVRETTGRKVLGRRTILKQSWTERPSTPTPRRKLSPRIAARCTAARVDAIRRYKEFVARYREAMAKVQAGETDVVFPYGTLRFARLHLVRVEPPPA
ncbi:MAG: transposase [Myxococcota bacterium]